jgi:small subunit ribosomal protein S1
MAQNTPNLKSKKIKYFVDDEYSKEKIAEFESLIDSSFRDVDENQIILGKIVGIQGEKVIIDVGFKSDGTIDKSEFSSNEEIKIGSQVEVVIEKKEDENGIPVLSKKRADFLKAWNRIMEAYKNDQVLQGKILKRIKGGMVVDLGGVEAFLPGSQIDVRPVRDFDAYVGKTMDFKVVKVNELLENVVVSHKALIEADLIEQRNQILESLEKGQILEGTVKAITDFGVFVDLNGVDGLIHITDLSWGRINHPSEVVKLDEVIKVVVTDFDKEKKRISLSLKQLQPHPWDNIEGKYKVGDKVSGKVVSLTDYGAFIEIEKGIEGLIHISEMSWTQHIKHPSQMVSMGQIVEAVILSLDKNEKKISLGMKQLTPDPWNELSQKYPVGSKHTVVVRNLTNFGAFVELEPGVDGLIHISDLSWTKKIRHPGEVVKKGDKIEVVVLSIDNENRRISLGYKQTQENPWPKFEKIYTIGKRTKGKVVRIVDKGVIVELPEGVDGFVPVSQLSPSKIKNIGYNFPIDDELELKVIEFDKETKKIVLSAIAALKESSVEEIEAYIKKHKLEKVSVDDIFKTETANVDTSGFPNYENVEVPSMPKSETQSASANENQSTSAKETKE